MGEENTEESKLPEDIQKEIKNQKERDKNIDWYGIDAVLTESAKEDTIDKSSEDFKEVEIEPESNTLVQSVVHSMINVFSSQKEIVSSDSIEMGYFKVGNVKIKDGVLYAKSVQDIIDSKIVVTKNILLVIVPHTVKVNEDYSYDVALRYLKHNGSWWVALNPSIPLEDIEFDLFDPSNIKDKKILSISA